MDDFLLALDKFFPTSAQERSPSPARIPVDKRGLAFLILSDGILLARNEW
jgi:hypothetical protein